MAEKLYVRTFRDPAEALLAGATEAGRHAVPVGDLTDLSPEERAALASYVFTDLNDAQAAASASTGWSMYDVPVLTLAAVPTWEAVVTVLRTTIAAKKAAHEARVAIVLAVDPASAYEMPSQGPLAVALEALTPEDATFETADPRIRDWVGAHLAHRKTLEVEAIQAAPRETVINRAGELIFRDVWVTIEGKLVKVHPGLYAKIADWFAIEGPKYVATVAAQEEARKQVRVAEDAARKAASDAQWEIVLRWAAARNDVIRTGRAAGYDQREMARAMAKDLVLKALPSTTLKPDWHRPSPVSDVTGADLATLAVVQERVAKLAGELPDGMKVEVGKVSKNERDAQRYIPVEITGLPEVYGMGGYTLLVPVPQ